MLTILFEDEFFASDEAIITKTKNHLTGKMSKTKNAVSMVATFCIALGAFGTFPEIIKLSPSAYATPVLDSTAKNVQTSIAIQQVDLQSIEDLYKKVADLQAANHTLVGDELEIARKKLFIAEWKIAERIEQDLQRKLSDIDSVIDKAEQLVEQYEIIKS